MDKFKAPPVIETVFTFLDGSPWTNEYRFYEDLSKFFGDHGVEARISPFIEGQSGRKWIWLSPKEKVLEKAPEHQNKPNKSIAESLNKLGKVNLMPNK